MRFRILNKNPMYDYREACKITQGIDISSIVALSEYLNDENNYE